MLGILLRTRHDRFTAIAFQHAEEVLQASRDGGHIFIDLAAETATKENFIRILRGLGRPSEPAMKLAVFYCHGNSKSPVDQFGKDFISDDMLSSLAGWGVYCIGCDVGQSLGHKLLAAGAHFLIAFNSDVTFVASHEEETFKGLNLGILEMLREGISPSTASDHMRQFFEEAVDRMDQDSGKNAWLRTLSLFWNAKRLAYYGPIVKEHSSKSDLHDKTALVVEEHSSKSDLHDKTALVVEEHSNKSDPHDKTALEDQAAEYTKLNEIEPGRKHARRYQEIIVKILHELFSPHIDEPQLEVSNKSGSSRYDIVFMNRAVSGFWHDIKISRHNSVVIFDAKNKKELDPSDADQMLRYASPWRGDVVFVVSRSKPSDAFSVRTADLLKEKEVCLIVLSDADLGKMVELKRAGKDPTIIVERLYRQQLQGS